MHSSRISPLASADGSCTETPYLTVKHLFVKRVEKYFPERIDSKFGREMEQKFALSEGSQNTYVSILPVNFTSITPAVAQEEDTKFVSCRGIRHLKKSFSNIVVTFLKVGYAIGFAPFKIKQKPDEKFYRHQWLPQQIIWVFGVTSSIFYRFQEVLITLPMDKSDWSPVLYFVLFRRMVNLIFNISIWASLWIFRERILQLVQFSYERMTSPSLAGLNQKLSRLVAFIGITNVLYTSFCFVNGTDQFEKALWDPALLVKCFAAHTKSLSFCIEKNRCTGTEDFPLDEMSILDIILTGVVALSRYFRKTLGITEELLVLVGPLTLWAATKDFVSDVLEAGKRNESVPDAQVWFDISKKHKDLKEFTDFINRIYGPMMLSYTLTALFYFSIHLDEFLTAYKDAVLAFQFFVYYIMIVSTFTICAEIPRLIGKLGPWISNHLQGSLSEMSQKELTMILHEINSNRIGMSACGLFTLTYSVVAQMTGVVVTYFIIIVQYRDKK